MKELFYIIGVIIFIAIVVIFGPIAVIWALNTLFVLSIPTNIYTWSSVLILWMAVRGVSTSD